MTQNLNYKEGSWFTVPLESGEFAIGLVARMAPGGSIILAYFFDKVHTIPTFTELARYKPIDANKIAMVGDLGIINGEWKVIGELPDWDRSLWRIPNFVRREEFTNRIWLVQYSDDDPNLVISEERVDEKDVKNLEPNVLWGYKSAEKHLSKLFN